MTIRYILIRKSRLIIFLVLVIIAIFFANKFKLVLIRRLSLKKQLSDNNGNVFISSNFFKKLINNDFNVLDNKSRQIIDASNSSGFFKKKERFDENTDDKKFIRNDDVIKTTIEIENEFLEPENCEPTSHRNFPLCVEKFNSLHKSFQEDKCLNSSADRNNSRCFVFDYLTKVEPYCPGKKYLYVQQNEAPWAEFKFDLEGFLNLFNDAKYKWIKDRASFYWPDIISEVRVFTSRSLKYKKKNIVIYFGAFNNFEHFLVNAGKGGYLGELVQWTDLIISLYILGHEITILRTAEEMKSYFKMKKEDCPISEKLVDFDVIYTDITGVRDITEAYFGERNFAKYHCKLRILDSFGTFPEYNYKHYSNKIPGGRSPWGDFNFLMPQLLTLYPHTHDNRFLGFVSRQNSNSNPIIKKKQALLYAKHAYYTNGYFNYLKIISEYFEIHATSVESKDFKLPSFIKNHGSVPSNQVHELLAESVLFIGVGFPYEGPGPLEAMSNGAVYLQPKFDQPVDKLNTPFLERKPTLRKMTSQNPYMEEFVGKPYCYTINITDENLLRNTLREIQEMNPTLKPKVPKEFTTEGFLERVHAYTSLMDLCNPYAPRWPPVKNMEISTSSPGQSCKDTCMAKGLVCEATYFDLLNKTSLLEKFTDIECNNVLVSMALHAPSFNMNDKTCYLQSHHLVFSCMHSEPGFVRLCPCRDYEYEQSAICKGCL